MISGSALSDLRPCFNRWGSAGLRSNCLLDSCNLPNHRARGHLEKVVEGIEAIGIQRNAILFSQPQFGEGQVKLRQNVVVERLFVYVIHSNPNGEIWSQTAIKA